MGGDGERAVIRGGYGRCWMEGPEGGRVRARLEGGSEGGGGMSRMGDGQNEERILNENLIISNNTNRQLVSYWLVL